MKQVGEALLTLGGPNSWAGAEMLTSQQVDDIIAAVQKRLKDMQADMTILRRRTLPGASKADAGESHARG